MILLGAGVSIEACIPGVYEMTSCIAKHFRQNGSHRHARVLSFVILAQLFGDRGTGHVEVRTVGNAESAQSTALANANGPAPAQEE